MEITYKITEDDRFKTMVEYILEVDTDTKQVEWIIYPHAPKDMHFKAADQYGLGGKHHNGIQSFDDFYSKPKYEINPITKDLIFQIIHPSKSFTEKVNEMRSIVAPKELQLSNKDYFVPLRHLFELDGEMLFRIYSSKEEDIKKLRSLIALLESPY